MIDVGPPPQVDWDDVAFDWEAARAAAAACRRLATVVEDVVAWQQPATVELLIAWRGRLAEVFDEQSSSVRWFLDACHEQLLGQARALERVADDAEEEQAVRERQRAAWHDWDVLRRRAEERAA